MGDSDGAKGHPTIAAAAWSRGRPAVTRSFRFHRPRGAPCGQGWCGTCEVQTAEGRVLACRADARDATNRALGPDPLRLLGRAAERFPPWFYEHRALRLPLALHALRRLSAAPRLAAAESRPPRRLVEEELEVATVGRQGNVRGLVVGVYGDRTLGVVRDDALVSIRFERLVLATGAYDRLPTVPGNDLPGVIGLGAFEAYARQGAFSRGLRVAVWGPTERVERALRTAARHDLRVVAFGDETPERLLGRRGRLVALAGDSRQRCDIFVSAVAQPALELAAQAGAHLTLAHDGVPVVVAARVPEWLELRGSAAAKSAGVPVSPASHDGAFACFCEDVRVRDVRRAIAGGFAHPELVKRRTGAMTGPCQGKLCAGAVLALLREAGAPHEPTTTRPPTRAIALADLVAGA